VLLGLSAAIVIALLVVAAYHFLGGKDQGRPGPPQQRVEVQQGAEAEKGFTEKFKACCSACCL